MYILSFQPKTSTFDVMKSSGHLHLLRDETLRLEITDYYNEVQNILRDIEYVNENYFENVLPYIFDMNGDVNSIVKHGFTAGGAYDVVEVDPFNNHRFAKRSTERTQLINALSLKNYSNALISFFFERGKNRAAGLQERLNTYQTEITD